MNRLRDYYRQIIALILLAGLGLFAYQYRELFTKSDVSPQAQAFSSDREKADQAYLRQDWSRAQQNYRLMTERDPFNGYAWYSLGESIWQQARRLLNERDRALRSLVADASRMEELNSELKQLGEEAVDSFMHARDTGRFRILAGRRMAEIYSVLGDKQLALKMLVDCYDDGMTLRGLKTVAEFLPLHGEPEFEDLAKRDPRSTLRPGTNLPLPGLRGGPVR